MSSVKAVVIGEVDFLGRGGSLLGKVAEKLSEFVFFLFHYKLFSFCLLYPMSATVLLCYVIFCFSCPLAFLSLIVLFPRCSPLCSHYPSLSALLKPQSFCLHAVRL